jgi:hypothetical protein
MTRSQNGWPVLLPAETQVWSINDGPVHFRLAKGDAGFVLAHFALWFAEEVERIQGDTWDDWGYAVRPIRGVADVVSNHASGTALDINAQAHPLGVRHTFTDRQVWDLTQRLRRRYGGLIRWGGTYQRRADEMHFEIAGTRPEVRALRRLLLCTDRGRRVRSVNGGATRG